MIISRSLNAHHALAVYEAAASCLLRVGVPSGQVMPLLAFLDAIALGSAIEPFAAGFTGSIGDYRSEYPAIAESLSHSRRRRIDDEGFEVERQNGVLQVIFEEPGAAKFIVSPNAPVKQIWLSAMSKSYKLSWDEASSTFALAGESLETLVTRLATEFLAA